MGPEGLSGGEPAYRAGEPANQVNKGDKTLSAASTARVSQAPSGAQGIYEWDTFIVIPGHKQPTGTPSRSGTPSRIILLEGNLV